eukprot:s2183_g8.t1
MGLLGNPHEDPGHAESWGIVAQSSFRGLVSVEDVFEAAQASKPLHLREAAKRRFGETEKQRGEREVKEGQAYFASYGLNIDRPSSRASCESRGRPFGMLGSSNLSRRPEPRLQTEGGKPVLMYRSYSNPLLCKIMDQDRTRFGGFFTGNAFAAPKVNR